MTIAERLITMFAQWAKNAQTNIPTPPIPGVAYRNAAIGADDFEQGQAYDKVYDSGRYNQRDYLITGLLRIVEEYGGIPWSSLTTYPEGGFVLGLNKRLYQSLQPTGPKIAGVGAKIPGAAGSEDYWLDYAKSITPPPVEKYDLGQYYWFEDELERPGLFSCQAGVVQNFSKYTAAVAYFLTEHGRKRLVTKAEYDALHVYSWHTKADGSKVGWEGIGGVNKFVWDKVADTLTLPDLAGMTPEQVGYDTLGVGGTHGDAVRNMLGGVGIGLDDGFGPKSVSGPVRGTYAGGNNMAAGGSAWYLYYTTWDSSRVVPTAAKNQVRA